MVDSLPQTTLCHIDATTRKENRKMIIIYLLLFVLMKIITIMIILLDIKSKLEEFTILLNRHYRPQMACEFLARITDQLNNANGEDFLDEQLTWLRDIS